MVSELRIECPINNITNKTKFCNTAVHLCAAVHLVCYIPDTTIDFMNDESLFIWPGKSFPCIHVESWCSLSNSRRSFCWRLINRLHMMFYVYHLTWYFASFNLLELKTCTRLLQDASSQLDIKLYKSEFYANFHILHINNILQCCVG